MLKRARRRNIPAKAKQIQTALRTEHLGQPAVVTAAYAASTRSVVAFLGTLNGSSMRSSKSRDAGFGRVRRPVMPWRSIIE